MLATPGFRQGRGRPEKIGQDVQFSPQTVEQLGIGHKQAQRWQAEARVPDQHYHAYLAGARFFLAADASQGAANPSKF